jgi:hypothetical protein
MPAIDKFYLISTQDGILRQELMYTLQCNCVINIVGEYSSLIVFCTILVHLESGVIRGMAFSGHATI